MIKERLKIKKNSFTDYVNVLFSSVISLFRGLIISFLIPKILSKPNFADYRIFVLYISYSGLFHLGMNDGFVLKYVGKKYEEIGNNTVKTYFISLFSINVLVLLILLLIINIFGIYVDKALLLSIICYSVIHNLYDYIENIFKITMEFRKYSLINIFNNISKTIFVIFAYFVFNNSVSSFTFIQIFIISEILSLIFGIVLKKEMILGKFDISLINNKKLFNIIKDGLYVLIVGILSTLIMNMDKQFVSLAFNKDDYADYSFVYSISQVVITIVVSVSVIILPKIKKLKKEELKNFYSNSIINLLLSFVVFAFIPVGKELIRVFIPKYYNSLQIFETIAPMIVLYSLINLISINYFKANNLIKRYTYLIIVICVLSITMNSICMLYSNSLEAYAISVVLVYYVWFIICDIWITKNLNIKNHIFVVTCYIISYYLFIYLTYRLSSVVAVLVYVLCVVLIFYLSKKEH